MSTDSSPSRIDEARIIEARIIEVSEEKSLLENLVDQGVQVDHSCGGNGTCGTCRVQVLDGYDRLSERNELEIEMKEDRGFSERERLCCQTTVLGPISIKIS